MSVMQEYKGRLWGTKWRHRWRHREKYHFLHNLGRLFHTSGQIEAVFSKLKFSKQPPFWARDKLFAGRDTGIEYTRKKVISISDILSFCPTF